MAQARITNTIGHTSITTNIFNVSSGSTSYSGYFILAAEDGYCFENVTDTYVMVSSVSDYKVKYQSGSSTYNVPLRYVSEENDENGKCVKIRFANNGLITQSIMNNYWTLSGEVAALEPSNIINITTTTANCTTNAPQNVLYTDTLNITATANNGYYFDNAPTLTIYDESGTVLQTVNFTIAQNGLTATANVDLSQISGAVSVTINASAIEQPKSIEIQNNIAYFTTNAPSIVYEDTKTFTITASANNGYQFELSNMPRVATYDDNGALDMYYFTASADRLTATVTINPSEWDFDIIDSVFIVGRAIEIPSNNIIITQNTTQCTTNAPTTISSNDTNFIITATANNGYHFENTPVIKFTDDSGNIQIDTEGDIAQYNFAISNDKTTATVTIYIDLLDFEKMTNAVIIANAAETDTRITIMQNLTNCVSNAPQYLTSTDNVLNVTLTANINCGFVDSNLPQLYILDVGGNPHVFDFKLQNNGLTAVLSFDVVSFGFNNIGNTFEIIGVASVITPYDEKYGNINVYKLTEKNLEEFGRQRFFYEVINPSDTEPQYEQVDLGKYVSSVKRIYFDIGNATANVLKCGNFNTNIAVSTPSNDNIIIDCGSVLIPSPNNNATDYNSEIAVFLPFVGLHSISTDYIGREIKLEYVCNIVTANAVAKLYCDDIPFDFVECTAANDLIYRTSESYSEYASRGALSFNMQVLKGLTPYVVVKSFVDENKQIYNNDNARVVIGDCKGFNKFEQIDGLSNGILNAEYVTIIAELEKGVFIN